MADASEEALLERARRASPSFGLARQQRAIWRVRRGLQTKRSVTPLIVKVAAAACLAVAAIAGFSWFRVSASVALVDERWQLRDGSRIMLETADTRITKQRDSGVEALFDLEQGAVRFDVTPRAERRFRVQAGPALVEVIGTLFRIERQGERTLVSVERGRVAVSCAGVRQELAAGEQAWFPSLKTASAPRERTPAPNERPSPLPAAPSPGPSASPLSDSSATAARPNAEALFVIADRARVEGRPSEAVRALRQLTQRFPRDPRAPLAAFTLGRLLLENLRQPVDAARAFELARALAGGGSAISEDALAREVEAWRAAGDASKATARARRYQTLYPRGAHITQVVRLGELTSGP
jgi:transmembrane sensor